MAPAQDAAQPAKSGIKKLTNGDSIIPSSTRPDGSVRKEIRVKPGYKPPEDVEVYKNRTAAAWKNSGKSGGVPGAEAAANEKLPPHKAAALAGRNAKRREARKKAAAAAGEDDVDEEDEPPENGAASVTMKGADGTSKVANAGEAKDQVDLEAEKAKEARKLAKKLRQARDLADKKGQGDGMLPEQLLKITRINELVRQLDNLGFDHDGEKKQDGTQQTAG